MLNFAVPIASRIINSDKISEKYFRNDCDYKNYENFLLRKFGAIRYYHMQDKQCYSMGSFNCKRVYVHSWLPNDGDRNQVNNQLFSLFLL